MKYALWLMLLAANTLACAEPTLMLYGPGGPASAMKAVAQAFQQQTGVVTTVTAGPPPQWMAQARTDADALFSGSQNMMDGFLQSHDGLLAETVQPLFLRPSTILVRKGNPKQIGGVRDLLQPDLRVMVVQGAGQVGLWEDVVGRLRDIASLRQFRGNIAVHAPNSGAARQRWIDDPTLDAWLIWNHWQIDNPTLADPVPVEPDLAIYRDTAIATTKKGQNNPDLSQFLEYLEGDEAAAIFQRHGWQWRF